MPDPVARKLLKKRILDRWENEGGAIAAYPGGADDPKPRSEQKGKSKQRSASRNKSTVSGPPSTAKKRKLPRK